MITQSPGLPEVVRINAIHLYEGRERKKEEQLSNCQRSHLTAVDEERGRKANILLESTGTVGWSVEKELVAVSRRYPTGLKHADKFDELGRKEWQIIKAFILVLRSLDMDYLGDDCVRVSNEQPQDLEQTAEAVLNPCPLERSRAL